MMVATGNVKVTRRGGRGAILAAWSASVGIVLSLAAVHSNAQVGGIPPPEFALKDENYVDLVSFALTFDLADLSIGSKEHPLTHSIYSGPLPDTLLGHGYFRDSYFNVLFLPAPHQNPPCADRDVVFGNSVEYFGGATSGCLYSTSPFPAVGQTGSILTGSTYTQRDGTNFNFSAGSYTDASGTAFYLAQILYPDGRVLTIGYCTDGLAVGAICSVTRSDGLQLKYNFALLNGSPYIASIVAINNAYEYCSPTAGTCALTKSWPTVSYAWSGPPGAGSSVLTVTDPAGRQTRYTQDAKGRTVGIKLPSSASADDLTYSYCDSSSNWCSKFVSPFDSSYQNYVQSVLRDGHTWTYSGNPGAANSATGTCGLGVYSVTNPVGGVETVSQDYCFPDAQDRRGAYGPGNTPFMQIQTVDGTIYSSGASLQSPALDPAGRVWVVIKPEGNQVNYTWDTRGNLTQAVKVPKPGSPLAQVTLSANYDTTCTNQVTCNKPHWVKDGLLNETDYTYDPTHGGVLTVTLPADVHGIRPQTRYTYTQRYAWVLNASGAYVQSAAPIWVLATESFCRTVAASPSGIGCTVLADQVVRTYEYGPNSGPNNLFPRGVSVTADGITHRTCYAYDPMGNKVSETEPAAALASCP